MTSQTVESFWSKFVSATGIDGPYTAFAFGDTAVMATDLALLVRDGPKRATASLLSGYGDDEPLPRGGEMSVVLDGQGEPVCVTRTTGVEVRRFADVDAEFADAEGEGDRTLEHWRREHRRFFATQGVHTDDDTEVVLERFELLWP